ncbi:aconitate hydratase [Hallella multisaccharivorax DSM 17128]|uniref:Aconitate hydratase A n=1 Tax=Hallella multisaccharivorax DSM 17128 TaxID=688246 RepID=F8NAS8_9BACT|nr:aconitate hydratase [Hallella multisaccharivorax]EGN56826.1 aconitase [Hallella multisaccharivorax DSM 17128]GJG30361.1 aconitate hydratase [Hallella multisaccharivorax DSM 17128]
MTLDLNLLKRFYASYASRIKTVRTHLGHPLTYAEKVLFSHLYNGFTDVPLTRGESYVDFRPDRVAMQDATAQMALLQFMNAGKSRVAVPTTVHCDHLIRADMGVEKDLPAAKTANKEVYDFLQSASAKYGIGFWAPGAGIIHQVVLENYAFPGGMMIGTDSHTPNAGGLGMVAVGVGGADAVDVITDQAWELKLPRLIGVRLTGRLSEWASPKDVILDILGRLTVKGGTNAILEYFGEGVNSLSATGRATVCNMGAELGATCSLFPFDEQTAVYLRQTGRDDVAEMAMANVADLSADNEVVVSPEKYYDQLIDVDLSSLEPHLNGPFTPDAATSISDMGRKARQEGYPLKVEAALIGSCTNSSYQDLARAASVARQAAEKHIPVKTELIINPGSEMIRYTAERDGLLKDLRHIGGVIMTNACGPCIGQWKRHTDDNTRKNTIVTSFNRNFRRRADGNPNTYAFIGSPEMVVALAIAGRLDFNPATDKLVDEAGNEVMLAEPSGNAFPPAGFAVSDRQQGSNIDQLQREGLFIPPHEDDGAEVVIAAHSERLQRLAPFPAWDGKDLTDMPLLIKTRGKCTTDHISMAGPWLRFRGHLQNISDNLLMGAVNAFNGESNLVKDQIDGQYKEVSTAAKDYKAKGVPSIIVAEDNYGEGSSREHAAMEPRFLNVRVVLAKSFARIHETNLKKQGMLALTFADKDDYDKVKENDRISVTGLNEFAPGSMLTVTLNHQDGTVEAFEAKHTYNELQINWFKAGSALNYASGKRG